MSRMDKKSDQVQPLGSPGFNCATDKIFNHHLHKDNFKDSETSFESKSVIKPATYI